MDTKKADFVNKRQLIRLFTAYWFFLIFSFFSANVFAEAPTNELIVKLISGATSNPIPGHRITAYEQLPGGTEKWIKNTTTDEQGIALLLLQGLNEGRSYILKSKNPFDMRYQTSEVLKLVSTHTFVLGNKLLKVNLANGINNQSLPETKIVIYKRLENNELNWERQFITDSSGHFDVDLPGLGSGVNYVLRTNQLYGGGSVYSEDITQTGVFNFRVGNLHVNLISGATKKAIANHEISVYEKLPGEKDQWRAKALTDKNGIVDFHLTGLGEGHQYILKAKNPFDMRYKSSAVLMQTGNHTFELGHKLLHVHLLNAVDLKGITNNEVTAYLRKEDASLEWFQRMTTDASGKADFELPGLDNGSAYVLKARHFGVNVFSTDIKDTGMFEFIAGRVPVKLSNTVNGQPITPHELTLYEKTIDGKLQWRAKAVTDANGIVRFDPDGFNAGRIYVVRAKNIFGNNKNYYSRWITENGSVDFAVGPDSPNKLDLEPPQFTAISPNDNAFVNFTSLKIS